MTGTPVPTEVFVGPMKPGGWALRAEFCGDFDSRIPGFRLDMPPPARERATPLGLPEGGWHPQPWLTVPRHDPYVLFRPPQTVPRAGLDTIDRDFLNYAVRGLTMEEAVRLSGFSEQQVKNWRSDLIGRLGARDMQDAVTRAIVLSEIEVIPEVQVHRRASRTALRFLGYASVGLTAGAIGTRFGRDSHNVSQAMERLSERLSTLQVRVHNEPQTTYAAFAQGMLVVGKPY